MSGADAQREQRELIEQWRRQAQRPADLPQTGAAAAWLPPVEGEQPCRVLQAVRIEAIAPGPGTAMHPVPLALGVAPDDYLGICLGAASLQRLQANLQGRLHALGFVTSLLELPEQALDGGVLTLQLRWGLLGQIHFQRETTAEVAPALPGRNALAVQSGSPLNLRDIEHTLENLARLPSQTARFMIEPGRDAYTSDLRIVLGTASTAWRASLGLDAADLRHGSPWDVQAQAWVDAPLGWSDQWQLSASGAPQAQGPQRSRRHSLYTQWSLPWERHLLSVSASLARNNRSIAGGVGSFVESSDEMQAGLRWQWTPWRGADWRSMLWLAWNERRSRSHIDDVELLGRRRTSGELSFGVSHWRRLACGEISAELEGTQTRRLARVADFQNLQAPLPRQWRVQFDMHCTWPMPVEDGQSGTPGVPWTWALTAWSQAVERPFDGTDLLSLGGRYTVRGHTAEQSLQGRRISVVRFSATAPGQPTALGLVWQPWLAWDAGRLERPADGEPQASPMPRGRQAAVLGMRWQAGTAAGELSWARAIGPSPASRHGLWQAQAQWRF